MIYIFMQLIGFRYMYWDWAFRVSIPLDSFECWSWMPHLKMGAYSEVEPCKYKRIGFFKR